MAEGLGDRLDVLFQLMIGVIRKSLSRPASRANATLLESADASSGRRPVLQPVSSFDRTVSVLSAAWKHELAAMARIVPN